MTPSPPAPEERARTKSTAPDAPRAKEPTKKASDVPAEPARARKATAPPSEAPRARKASDVPAEPARARKASAPPAEAPRARKASELPRETPEVTKASEPAEPPRARKTSALPPEGARKPSTPPRARAKSATPTTDQPEEPTRASTTSPAPSSPVPAAWGEGQSEAPARARERRRTSTPVPPASARTRPEPAADVAPSPKLAPTPRAPAREGVSGPVVLWVASEAVPWASAGGLGDVVGSLPAFLRGRGWDVRLVLPYYSRLTKRPVSAPIFETRLRTSGAERVAVRQAIDPPGGVPTYLVECEALFGRPGLYGDNGGGYNDAPYRYGVFQLAVRAFAARLEPAPSIIHCHDWHTGLLPALLQMPGERPAALKHVRTIFTIHNLQYQGDSSPDVLDHLGVPRRLYHHEWGEHFGCLMPMKAGITAADRVTTVSPTYAGEIRTAEHGMGLDGELRHRGAHVRGILNGIDTRSWDPTHDPNLPTPFSWEDPDPRAEVKAALRKEIGLPGTDDELLIGFVGRLTREKGIDLVLGALPGMLSLGAKVVVLGTGDRGLEAALTQKEWENPDRFRAILRFDTQLARRIYGGVDVLLVPSKVEPCGLVQLYGLRYGAVPVVHAVGGLRDTVKDGVTGFTFTGHSPAALLGAVARAATLWSNRAEFRAMRRRGMSEDWSWSKSAEQYEALYRDVLAGPPRLRPLPVEPEPRAGLADWGPHLPATLGRETLQLLVQGPSLVGAYWELPSAQASAVEILIEERPSGALYQMRANGSSHGEAWFPSRPEAAYRAVARDGNGRVVAISNAVITPRDVPPPPSQPRAPWLEHAIEIALPHAPPSAWDQVFPESPAFALGERPGDLLLAAPPRADDGEATSLALQTLRSPFPQPEAGASPGLGASPFPEAEAGASPGLTASPFAQPEAGFSPGLLASPLLS